MWSLRYTHTHTHTHTQIYIYTMIMLQKTYMVDFRMWVKGTFFICIISKYCFVWGKIVYPLAILLCFFQIIMFSTFSRVCKTYPTLHFVNECCHLKQVLSNNQGKSHHDASHHLLGTIRNMKWQVPAIWTESTWTKTQKKEKLKHEAETCDQLISQTSFGFSDESFRKEVGK